MRFFFLAVLAFVAVPVFAQGVGRIDTGACLVLGPFEGNLNNQNDIGLDVDYFAPQDSEANVAPVANSKSAGRAWKSLASSNGRINFQQLWPGSEHKVAYVYREFNASSAGEAALKIGSDDGVKVWLNGHLVLSNPARRALSPNEDAVRLQLKEGKNRLLMKVDQVLGEWELQFRLRTIAEELSDAQKSPPGMITLGVERHVLEPGQNLAVMVSSSPAWILGSDITLSVRNRAGKVLMERQAHLGDRFELRVEGLDPSALYLTAAGSALGKTLLPAWDAVILGDPETVLKAESLGAKKRILKGDPNQTSLRLFAQLIDDAHADLSARIAALAQLFSMDTQKEKTGLQRFAYESPVDGSALPYTLYVPLDYKATKKYALLVALHGYGGEDFEIARRLSSAQPKDFIVVAPSGRGDLAYQWSGEQDVLDVISLVRAGFNIDSNKMYLCGESMGGYGTYSIAKHNPGLFAAIASFAGWTGTSDGVNLLNTSVLVVHGGADQSVDVAIAREVTRTLKLAGAEVRYDELDGVGHNSMLVWCSSDTGAGRLFEYFRQHVKKAWPKKVGVAGTWLGVSENYWLRVLDSTRAQARFSMEATVVDDRHIVIRSDNVESFELDLGHPVLSPKGRILVNVDGQGVTVDAGTKSLVLTRSEKTRRFETKAATTSTNPPHRGGGVFDLFLRPVLVVYGTSARDSVQLKAAQAFSTWVRQGTSDPGTRYGGFELIADTAVTDQMLASHDLVLFGGATENAITARLSLPYSRGNQKLLIQGKETGGAGIIASFPSSFAPSRLAAVVDVPYRAEILAKFCAGLSLAMRSYGISLTNELFLMPDVQIYDLQGNPIWRGEYDASWSKLRALN